MRYASVCSGVESASLAWEPLGWGAVWFSEIEPFPCAVLKERYPNVPNLGDMTKIKGEDYDGAVDLLVGGTPCQGFSVGGRRGGLRDPRSQLCLKYVELLKTMRPRWFVWENVPGALSTEGGGDYWEFLRQIDAVGYSCAWRVLDAQYIRGDGFARAIPQRRRRLFVVGHIGDWKHPCKVLFDKTCVPRDSETGAKVGKAIAGKAGKGIGTGAMIFDESVHAVDFITAPTLSTKPRRYCCCYENHAQDSRIKEVDVSPAITARDGTGGGNLPIVQNDYTLRRLLPVECERLMGFPDNWTRIRWKGKSEEDCPDAPRYKACGNSMCVNVMRWIGMRIEQVDKEAN